MKKLKSLCCVLLVVAVCAAAMLPASAKKTTNYLSELQLAEADTSEAAKALLTQAGFEVLDKNLNPDGKKAVYLGYKRSENVDDAITDVRVMRMNGGFNAADYESIVADALNEYGSEIDNLRTAANEFAESYKAGKQAAVLAYRLLNCYYAEVGNEKISMGDYMCAFPESNEEFADILLKGNTDILDNLRILLAMGVADSELLARIQAAAADEAVYGNEAYQEASDEMLAKLTQLSKLYTAAQAATDAIRADTALSADEQALALLLPGYINTLLVSLGNALESIAGDSSNSENMQAGSTDSSLLAPFAAAMTPGQLAMAVSGQLHSVIIYSAADMGDEALAAQLAEAAQSNEPVSVYSGTDMSLANGAIGVTSDALVQESRTGNRWFACLAGKQEPADSFFTLLGAGGMALASTASCLLMQQNAAAQPTENLLQFSDNAIAAAESRLRQGEIKPEQLANCIRDFADECAAINTNGNASSTKSLLTASGQAIGIAMIAFRIYSIVQIADKYNADYTGIPTHMVDAVKTDNGKAFIDYKVVNAFYADGDEIKERPGDTNAYSGSLWNALYYTKRHEAGKCLTTSSYILENADDYGKYTPVAGFSEDVCYDLNANNTNNSEAGIFVAFASSGNKKSDAASVTDTISNILTIRPMMVSAVVGIGVGMCLMSVIKRKKEAPEA